MDNSINKVKDYINKRRWLKTGVGVLAGALAGFLYWKFIGCKGGTCPLTSNPYQTIFLFSVFGGIFAYDSPAKKK